MFDSTLFDSRRSLIVSAFAAVALIACGGGEATSTDTVSEGGQYEVAGDYAIGNKDAKVTVVEYASVVCGACANWATTVYPDFKAKYVDTGKVRYVFRPFPTSPAELADAGHMIAMCAAEDKFMQNIKLQFERQKQIFEMANQGKARDAYVSLAKASGLSEDEFLACMQNQDIRAKYDAVVQGGVDAGVSGTPSFFINGEKSKVFTLESMDEVILPLLGEAVPAKAPAEPTE
ncbi:thioredoxin domain-containing protein [Litorimonas sp. RW-G-Af-16]|uniref:thioredoxin domain-containing protein n=1 Tax=Litorimonas sp. RW-G-Af-16 TaxID=3241168 RepID=UPI00390C4289